MEWQSAIYRSEIDPDESTRRARSHIFTTHPPRQMWQEGAAGEEPRGWRTLGSGSLALILWLRQRNHHLPDHLLDAAAKQLQRQRSSAKESAKNI